MRKVYALAGAFVLIGVDLLVEFLAAAIQQKAFGDQYSNRTIWWFVGLLIIGVLAGYWLSGKVEVPDSTQVTTASAIPKPSKTTSITRLRALLSYGELKGKGIHLSDILLVGSVVKIDTD